MQPPKVHIFKTNGNVYINTFSRVLLAQNPPVLFKILPGFLELFINHLLSSTKMVQNNLGCITLEWKLKLEHPRIPQTVIVTQSKSLQIMEREKSPTHN